MSIDEILADKERQLKSTGNPLAVTFTADEINVLGDVNALRTFKLNHSIPAQFACATDIFDCCHSVLLGSSVYRVLEFCMLRNPVLVKPITTVFSWLKVD